MRKKAHAPAAVGTHATRACPSCSEPLEGVARFCTRCGADVGEETSKSDGAAPSGDSRHFSCSGCGAEVAFGATSMSERCPFCGSSAVRDIPATSQGAPEFVLGFAVGKEGAESAYDSWLRAGSFFRPADLRKQARIHEFRGVYIPCYSHSALAVSRYQADIGEHWYRTETYTTTQNGKVVTRTRQVQETEWYPLAGDYESWQSGHLVSASKGLPQKELSAILPYDIVALRRYSPEYLAGWLAETPSITREEAQGLGLAEFARRQERGIADFLPGDTQRGLKVETRFQEIAEDLIYVPLWIAAYRYKDRIFRFLLNGQTGKIWGKKPISTSRVLLAIGGFIALITTIVLVTMKLVQ